MIGNVPLFLKFVSWKNRDELEGIVISKKSPVNASDVFGKDLPNRPRLIHVFDEYDGKYYLAEYHVESNVPGILSRCGGCWDNLNLGEVYELTKKEYQERTKF